MSNGRSDSDSEPNAGLAYAIALAATAVLLTGAIAAAYANSGALILDLANSAATFFCL